MDVGKSHPHQEGDLQRGFKHPRGMQMRSAHEADRKVKHPITTPAWAPPMELNGAPLTYEASIWDFQGGMTGYIAHAMEQTLLLPKDMADLRSLRQYEVFLGLKKTWQW